MSITAFSLHLDHTNEYPLHISHPLPRQEEEEYDFEYSDEDENSEVDADSENSYYNAKGLKEDSLDDATAAFLKIVNKEKEDGEER
jgi:hypothetical protein